MSKQPHKSAGDAKRRPPVRIPLNFEAAVTGLVRVKPEPKGKEKRKASSQKPAK